MHTSYLQKGFTLIELLVVITIIGLLASVVIASLTNARSKGADATIKADLSSIRSSAALDYDVFSGRYSTTSVAVASLTCSTVTTPGTIFADINIQRAMTHILQANGNSDGMCNVTTNGSAYAITFPLKTASTYWCVDSTGTSRGKNISGTTYAGLNGQGQGTPANYALSDTTDTDCN